jgi:hypothetical protein
MAPAQRGFEILKKILFLAIAVVGLVPLSMNSIILHGSGSEAADPIRTWWIFGATSAVLLAGAWFVAGWLAQSYREDLSRFRSALKRVGEGNYRGWIRHSGTSSEARELGQALNRLTGNVAQEEKHLEREALESRQVAAQSLEFIEELLRARVPLAKHHPGLVESYSREFVARKKEAETTPSAQGFLRELMNAVLGKKARRFVRRRSRRIPSRSLWLAAPVEARITDLSASGMSVESLLSPQGVDPRPFTIVNNDETLTVPASVKWCRLVATERNSSGESTPIYRAGIEFSEHLPRRVRDALMQTLDGQVIG